MGEIPIVNHDPFTHFRDSIDELLGVDADAHDRETRMRADYDRVMISRNPDEGIREIAHIQPIEDDGFHRVYTFRFLPDGSAKIIMGKIESLDSEETQQVISEQELEPGTFWESMVHSMFETYMRLPKQ